MFYSLIKNDMANYVNWVVEIRDLPETSVNRLNDYLLPLLQEENANLWEIVYPKPKLIFNGDLPSELEEKYWRENCWYTWNYMNWWSKWCIVNSAKLEWNTLNMNIDSAREPVRLLLCKLHDSLWGYMRYYYLDEMYNFEWKFERNEKFETVKCEQWIPDILPDE